MMVSFCIGYQYTDTHSGRHSLKAINGPPKATCELDDGHRLLFCVRHNNTNEFGREESFCCHNTSGEMFHLHLVFNVYMIIFCAVNYCFLQLHRGNVPFLCSPSGYELIRTLKGAGESGRYFFKMKKIFEETYFEKNT